MTKYILGMIGTILFTDVKSSSKLWAKHPKDMLQALMKHEKIIRQVALKNNGIIVKTIGDAVMIKFNKISDGILCAVQIQKKLLDNPIKFRDGDLLQIRIGMAHGNIQSRTNKIQGFNLKDYFGTTVNMASRMESKVSTVGGFGILGDTLAETDMKLIKKFCSIQTIHFKYKCATDISRSTRIIADQVCQNISALHVEDGKEHIAYSCMPD